MKYLLIATILTTLVSCEVSESLEKALQAPRVLANQALGTSPHTDEKLADLEEEVDALKQELADLEAEFRVEIEVLEQVIEDTRIDLEDADDQQTAELEQAIQDARDDLTEEFEEAIEEVERAIRRGDRRTLRKLRRRYTHFRPSRRR